MALQPVGFDQSQLHAALNLVTLGVQGQRAREVNVQLDQFKKEIWFIPCLDYIYSSEQCPIQPAPPVVTQLTWLPFRQMAGLTLKNNVTKDNASEQTLVAIAQHVTHFLVRAAERPIYSCSAQIIAKVTQLKGVAWWTQTAQIDLSKLLLTDMLGTAEERVAGAALLVLGYLIEDAPTSIGASIAHIVASVGDFCVSPKPLSPLLRRRAAQTLIAPFETGAIMDWNVEQLDGFQQGLIQAAPKLVEVLTLGLQSLAHQMAATAATAATAVAAAAAAGGSVDYRMAQICLRGLMLSIEYTTYMPTDVTNRYIACSRSWVQAISIFIRAADVQCACEAFDFAHAIICFDSRTQNQDCLGLTTLLMQSLATIMPVVFHSMAMSESEARSLVENDGLNHRDPPKTNTRGSNTKKIKDDDDGGEASGDSLRESAGQFLDILAMQQAASVFPFVLEFAKAHWTSTDWRVREVTFLVLGAVTKGCAMQLEQFLPQFIPNLAETAGNDGQNVAVRSMALWTMSRTADWLFNPNGAAAKADLVRQVMTATLHCLLANSKRVRWAAISALRRCVQTSLTFDAQATTLSAYLGAAFETIKQCLASYHTNNLAVLSDLMIDFLQLMSDHNVGAAITPFMTEHGQRIGLLASTLTAKYQQHQMVDVNMDVFEIARVCSMYMAKFPHIFEATAMQWIGTYMNVVSFIAGMDTSDNIQLTVYPLFLVRMLTNAITTENYAKWVSESASALPLAAVSAMKTGDIEAAQEACYCLQMHFMRVGTHGVTGGSNFIVEAMEPHVDFVQDPWLTQGMALLLHKLAEGYGKAEGSWVAADRLIPKVLLQVRGDTYENSAMDCLAVSCAALLALRPHFATAHVVGEILSALRNLPNDGTKAEGSKYICVVISAMNPNQTVGDTPATWKAMLESFVRLLLSWQNEAAAFDGLPAVAYGAWNYHINNGNSSAVLRTFMGTLQQFSRNNLAQQFRIQA